jgi:hypothetical protein
MLDDELLAKYPPDDKQRFNQLSQVGQVLDQLLDARLELHLPGRPLSVVSPIAEKFCNAAK